ncbi:MAG: RNA polymerase sigma factor [Planctomycetes bacterium]|nr:RNA polymerase sigma factor [Planctomycetota bacterium]
MSAGTQTEAWVSAAQRGDRLALAKLLATFHPRLRAWTEARMEAALKAKLGPDDILQEVYLDVARQIAQFENRGPGAFLKWVSAILQNKLTDACRAAHCQIRDVDREVHAGGGASKSYWDLLDNMYADSGTPSRVIRREEALGALLTCIADLSEAHGQVIRLRFLEGCSVQEVASRLGKSEAAVVALTRRALDALRKSMDRRGEFTHGG